MSGILPFFIAYILGGVFIYSFYLLCRVVINELDGLDLAYAPVWILGWAFLIPLCLILYIAKKES